MRTMKIKATLGTAIKPRTLNIEPERDPAFRCSVFGVRCAVFSILFSQAGPAQCREKVFLDLGEFLPGDGIAGDEDQFDGPGEFMLMLPETFAEQAAGAAAFDGAADLFAGDDSESRAGAVGQMVPVGDEAALREAFALLPDAREIAVLRQSRGAAEAQAFRRFGGHRGLDRRQAFAALAAAIAQGGAATAGGFA